MEQLDMFDGKEIDAQRAPEEAHFYHIVASFQDCIDKYGCAFVLSKLSNEHRSIIKEKINA
jgi:hypothetical protein